MHEFSIFEYMLCFRSLLVFAASSLQQSVLMLTFTYFLPLKFKVKVTCVMF